MKGGREGREGRKKEGERRREGGRETINPIYM